jgi:type II secretory ATPase GspE/PulE/Tfp pilus assembly ATPase PilB-like protein
MKTTAETNTATLIGVILVLILGLAFVLFAANISPASVFGAIQNEISKPLVIIIIASVLLLLILLLSIQMYQAQKQKSAAHKKFVERSELIIRPVRLYEIADELRSPISNYSEIQDSIKRTIRRGDEGIVDLVDVIITCALRSRASDIHLEPGFESVGVKYRIDGVLQDVGEIPKTLFTRFISRLRVLSNTMSDSRLCQHCMGKKLSSDYSKATIINLT